MADNQTGTGARGQQKTERGNHTRSSTDNRSKQIKENNRSTDRVDINRTANRK